MTSVQGLALSRVSVAYNGTAALAEVSLEFKPGSLVGLIGPNGAGKTTLLRLCAGLLKPQSGRAKLEGRPIEDWQPRDRARAVGYLAQDRSVQWPMTVERVVTLGRLPHLGAWDRPTAADAGIISRAMSNADVAHLAARPVTALSGGELARVLIARALAGTPRTLLADEPVAGLDPAHRLRVMEIFRGLAGEGRCVIVVLHDLTLAARYCDRLILLDQGHVAADGPPAAVLTPDLMARVYGVHATIATLEGRLMVVPWELAARRG
jgi:iron complex transport system ATP-binding protein